MKTLVAGAALMVIAASLPSAADAQGGNLAAIPANRIELSITGSPPVFEPTEFRLLTGTYYRLTITSDGAAEAGFRSPDLLDNIWLNLVGVGDVEIHLQGKSFNGLEFEGATSAYLSFVPVRPGEYEFFAPGVEGLRGTFIVE